MRRSFLGFAALASLTATLPALFGACSSSDTSSATGPGTTNAEGGTSGADSGSPSPTNEAGAPPLADAAADADAAVDPCQGRVICDDFESYTLGGKPGGPWTAQENSGTVSVSNTRAHSGTQSVKMVSTMATYQEAMIQVTGAPLFPVTNNTLYGKMWVYLENAAAHNVHWNMLSAGGPVPGHAGVTAVYDYGGMLDVFLALYDTSGASTDCGAHSKQSMPIGVWTCFAWVDKGPTNEMQLFDANGEITDMHITNMAGQCQGNDLDGLWLAPTFASAKVGWESVQTDVGHTMYVDDVTFDDKPLSCP